MYIFQSCRSRNKAIKRWRSGNTLRLFGVPFSAKSLNLYSKQYFRIEWAPGNWLIIIYSVLLLLRFTRLQFDSSKIELITVSYYWGRQRFKYRVDETGTVWQIGLSIHSACFWLVPNQTVSWQLFKTFSLYFVVYIIAYNCFREERIGEKWRF